MQTKTEIFIGKSKNIHGDRYDYSNVNYESAKGKVKILCNTHGIFEQCPKDHLSGSGCMKCFRDSDKMKVEEFIIKSSKIHEDKYDYSLSEYIKSDIKLKVLCKNHGEFFVSPNHHLRGKGCKKCGIEKLTENSRYTKDDILEIFMKKNTGYKYDMSEYKNTKSRILIECVYHGWFKQKVNKHLNGQGCPICRNSHGNKKIFDLLNDKGITFLSEYKFMDCKYKNQLRFDFYLPDYNTCVEFDGEQHFKKYSFEEDNNKLEIRQLRDSIKNEYCKNNNINLLRISYKEDIVEKLKTII